MKSNKILASADLNSSSFYAVVPFEYISSLPVFEVSIQGENYRFIFDTGGYTVFSDELTSRLSGIKKASYIDVKDGNSTVSRIDTYVLNELEIGGISFFDVGFANIGFTESEWFKCLGLDGTIGPNIMKEAFWQFDSKTQRITFTDNKNKLKIVSSGLKIPIYTDNVFKPSLDLQIGNETKRVGFDTGYNSFLKLIDKPESQALESYPSVVRLGKRSNAGNSVIYADTRMIKVDSIKLNGLVFTDVITSVGDRFSSDLLGSQLFDYYRIMLDLSGGAMYLEEIEGKPLMQGNIESFGFGLDFRDGKVVIDYVYEPSTANKIGVKPSQLVLNINGQNCEYSSYCDFIENFKAPDGDQIEIELLRDNKPYLISLSKEKIL
jgi:hypothetical protein